MYDDDVYFKISEKDLMDLIGWARRYCDGRSTYAPSSFNAVYDRIIMRYPEIIELDEPTDETLMDRGAYFPYAQDGMYDKKSGKFDARLHSPRLNRDRSK